MAVYTHVPAELLAQFLERYDAGELLSAKGIAEGVENSNYLVETGAGRFILTLYERRVAVDDLPYFLALLAHLADRGQPVPRPIPDRRGRVLQELAGRPACLVEFLSGVSVTEPTPAQAFAAGQALGRLHQAARDFPLVRENSLGPAGWRRLAVACGGAADRIAPGVAPRLSDEIGRELERLESLWPHGLPRSTVHADLFPDNVLLLDGRVSGVIDFYFACTDLRAYDLAVTHAAWSFSADGEHYHAQRAAALVAGYRAAHPLEEAEVAAFATLCCGASLRFLLTRAYDWLNTPGDAVVTRKDPLAFLRRLRFYRGTAVERLIPA